MEPKDNQTSLCRGSSRAPASWALLAGGAGAYPSRFDLMSTILPAPPVQGGREGPKFCRTLPTRSLPSWGRAARGRMEDTAPTCPTFAPLKLNQVSKGGGELVQARLACTCFLAKILFRLWPSVQPPHKGVLSHCLSRGVVWVYWGN